MHEAKWASQAGHQRLLINTVKHRDRLPEVFERAATQWRDEVFKFAVTVIDHVLHDLYNRDMGDDEAETLSGGNAV